MIYVRYFERAKPRAPANNQDLDVNRLGVRVFLGSVPRVNERDWQLSQ